MRWQAFKGAAIIGWGEADDHELGMEEARTCLEKGVVVLRPLDGDNIPGGDDDVPRSS